MLDCGDPDCGPTVGQCVALDPAAGKIGTVTGVTTCPTGYPAPTALMNGLRAGGCTGCACGAPPVSCSTNLSVFTSDQCSDVTKPGQSQGTFKTNQDQNCTVHPSWSTDTVPIYGLTTTAFTATASACAASGTPTLGAPSWGSVGQFCATSTVGSGCGTGKVCVPAIAPASACQIFDGAHACPTGTQTSTWYTGFTDTETYGACACGSPTGVSCSSMLITVGTDWTCSGGGSVGPNQRLCAGLGTWYLPAIKFTGTPAGTCQPQSTVGGSLTASGPKTVCCF